MWPGPSRINIPSRLTFSREQMFILLRTTPFVASIHKGKVSSAGHVCRTLLSSVQGAIGNTVLCAQLLTSVHSAPSSRRKMTVQLSHAPLLAFLMYLSTTDCTYGVIVFVELGGGIPVFTI